MLSGSDRSRDPGLYAVMYAHWSTCRWSSSVSSSGLRRPGWLALGWTAHVVWDVALHLERAQPVVGAWYPLACIGFDLIVAGYLLNAAVPSAFRALGLAATLLGAAAGGLEAQDSGRATAP